jgi:hypothetical protein
MTSLSALRPYCEGRPHCYGALVLRRLGPDHRSLSSPRRQRRLTLDELVFVALCLYPRYRLPGVEGFCSAEDVVDWLAKRKGARLGRTGESWLVRRGARLAIWPAPSCSMPGTLISMKGHTYAADGVVGRLGVYARVLLLQGPVGPFFAHARRPDSAGD